MAKALYRARDNLCCNCPKDEAAHPHMLTWRYFWFRPSIDRCIVKARETYRDCAYARINWRAHVEPIVVARVAAFAKCLKEKGADGPYHEILGENIPPWEQPREEQWLNSITVAFGARPLPLRPVIKVPTRRRVLTEIRAGMVFSQLASGGVVIAYYPPKSELAKPKREYYFAGVLSDPLELTRTLVDSLLTQLFRLDQACSAVTLRRGAGAEIMRSLERQDAAVRRDSAWSSVAKAALAAAKVASPLAKLVAAAHGAPTPPI